MANNPATYLLKTIELIEFSISQRQSDFVGKEFEFNVTAQTKINAELKIVFIVVSIETREQGNEKILSTIQAALGFEIQNFDDVIKLVGERLYEVELELEILLRTISVSTTRGILWSHLKGTYLNRAILPVIPQIVTPQEQEQLDAKRQEGSNSE